MGNIEKFNISYKNFFGKINSLHKIIVGGAHLYDIKEKKRIHQYFHVKEELKEDNFFSCLNKAFFEIKDRAKFFEIINLRSQKRKPLLWIRTTLNNIFMELKDLEVDQVLIPENLFLTNDDFVKNVILKNKSMKNNLIKRWHETSNTDEWKSFYSYLCFKLIKILGSDISENYKPQFDIFVMINSIMFYNWKCLYFFPTDPPGGFFVFFKDRLNQEEIESYYKRAQRITDELSVC